MPNSKMSQANSHFVLFCVFHPSSSIDPTNMINVIIYFLFHLSPSPMALFSSRTLMKVFNSSQLKADLLFPLLNASCSVDRLMNDSVVWVLASSCGRITQKKHF